MNGIKLRKSLLFIIVLNFILLFSSAYFIGFLKNLKFGFIGIILLSIIPFFISNLLKTNRETLRVERKGYLRLFYYCILGSGIIHIFLVDDFPLSMMDFGLTFLVIITGLINIISSENYQILIDNEGVYLIEGMKNLKWCNLDTIDRSQNILIFKKGESTIEVKLPPEIDIKNYLKNIGT